MTYANATGRQSLISGLRDLADFLESNPDVPAHAYIDVLVFPPSASDDEKRREVDVIASLISAGTATSSPRRHCTTSRRFGPVEYRVVAIPTDNTRSSGQ
jgi:hypothetical protein